MIIPRPGRNGNIVWVDSGPFELQRALKDWDASLNLAQSPSGAWGVYRRLGNEKPLLVWSGLTLPNDLLDKLKQSEYLGRNIEEAIRMVDESDRREQKEFDDRQAEIQDEANRIYRRFKKQGKL